MCADWIDRNEKKFKINDLLVEATNKLNVNSEGNLELGFQVFPDVAILAKAVKTGSRVHRASHLGLVRRALFALVEAGTEPTRDNFLNELNSQEAQYFREPKSKFRLLGTISFPGKDELSNLSRRKVADSTICFHCSKPSYFRYSRRYEDSFLSGKKADPEEHVFFTVTTQARRAHEAFEDGDILEGIFQY